MYLIILSQTCAYVLQIKIQTPDMTCVLVSAGRIEGDVQSYHVSTVPGHGSSRRRMHVLPRTYISFSPHIARAHVDAIKGRIHVLYVKCIQEGG
jgi:hypothetical protein